MRIRNRGKLLPKTQKCFYVLAFKVSKIESTYGSISNDEDQKLLPKTQESSELRVYTSQITGVRV